MELLAPGGDVDSIKAAILAGADAVFCGLNKFNARNRAANISFDNLLGIIRLAHKNDCEVFLTLNIIVLEPEIPELIGLLNKLVNTKIDGVIVQDLGLFYLLNKHFRTLKIHASTQLTTHNKGQIQFLAHLHATRVNLSRELNFTEIEALNKVAHQSNMLSEVFVHGSYCLSFSGICYMSSVHGGRSGNRGRCSQPCREKYVTTAASNDFPLNLKDNSAFLDLKELYEVGVDSLKIEGRIKEFEYVHTIVKTWRNQIDGFLKTNTLNSDNSELYRVFNRNFTNGFLKGEISRDMFTDNPMSYSTTHILTENNAVTNTKQTLYNEKKKNRIEVFKQIQNLEINKIPLKISVSGKAGEMLKVKVILPNFSFCVLSEVELSSKGTEVLTAKILLKRLKTIDETEYFIEDLDLSELQGEVYLPFKELTAIKKRLLFVLNDSNEWMTPVSLPKLKRNSRHQSTASLSVLISSEDDVKLCENSDAQIYYQLPSSLKENYTSLLQLFLENEKLVPWFPSVLIGEEYDIAVRFIKELKPKVLIANNSGIGFAAYRNKIPWIAGPFLNTSNSYSLRTLKDNFDCSGAFISNELNKMQIRNICPPKDFEIHYSIYHPNVLMSSRQCLFQQINGCTKTSIDTSCVPNCNKTATLENTKNSTFFIEKSPGNYHHIYDENNFMNTKIVEDIPNLFSGFMVDLRDIKTKTCINLNKRRVVSLFVDLIQGNLGANKKLHKTIVPTSNIQYFKGI